MQLTYMPTFSLSIIQLDDWHLQKNNIIKDNTNTEIRVH